MKKELAEGLVIESLPNANFKVKLDDDREVIAYLSGRMLINYIKVVVGDRVVVEISSYDKNKGRIIKRL